jgi:hypothetical protein
LPLCRDHGRVQPSISVPRYRGCGAGPDDIHSSIPYRVSRLFCRMRPTGSMELGKTRSAINDGSTHALSLGPCRAMRPPFSSAETGDICRSPHQQPGQPLPGLEPPSCQRSRSSVRT